MQWTGEDDIKRKFLSGDIMNNILKMTLALASISLPLQIQAIPITVFNAGFEAPAVGLTSTPPANWTVSGGGAGVWNINASPLGYWTVPAPEGNQIGFVSSAPSPGSPATLSQVLSTALAADTIYTLSGFVGHPIGYDSGTLYSTSLYAGGNLISSMSTAGPAGTFAPFNLVYNSSGSAFIGQALEIRLGSSQAQTAFDAISLNAQGASGGGSVSEGGLTILLLGMSLTSLGWIRRAMSE
ncbi:MAG: hypothetical protein WC429_04675 [Verrucomicrobiia bacterium]